MKRFVRNLTLILTATIVAAGILRPQLSSALVTRADGLAYYGSLEHARALYLRAAWLDGKNDVAVDRYVFAAMMSHDRALMGHAVQLASAYLKHDEDVTIREDRALCYQHLGWFSLAASDFARVGRERNDGRALMFAALDEKAQRHPQRARALLILAVQLDPHFTPARAALAPLLRVVR